MKADEDKAKKEHMAQFAKWYEPGVLQYEQHARLVQDIERLSASAKILPKYVSHSMKNWCSDPEIEWVRYLKKHVDQDQAGLVYSGKAAHIEDRMMAIAGACLRNYISATFMTVQEVITCLKHNTLPDTMVLLIPNFFLKKDEGGDLPSWESSSLLGMLYNRYSAGKQTVLYVQSIEAMASSYGGSFKTHLKDHYITLQS